MIYPTPITEPHNRIKYTNWRFRICIFFDSRILCMHAYSTYNTEANVIEHQMFLVVLDLDGVLEALVVLLVLEFEKRGVDLGGDQEGDGIVGPHETREGAGVEESHEHVVGHACSVMLLARIQRRINVID